jgi:ABC-type Mn2+/Zn2+ transport system permease subunit
MMNFIDGLLQYGFLQKALTTSIMVGIICGVIGCFIILRGMALMGDAISHAVLPGVALSYLLGINFFFGAVFTGILTALGIGFISQNSRIKNDVSIGIMFTAAFASGIILITFMKSSTDLYHILFGNVLAVRPSEMWSTLFIGILVLVCVYVFYKELLVSSFDPTMAAAYGLPTRLIHYFLMTLLTLVTVASLQTVGIILVVAMLITPASTAYLLTNRLWVMLYLSAGIGVLASILGLYFSYTYNLASGATIVLAATALFVLAFVFSPKQGLMWRAIKNFRKREMYSRIKLDRED